MRISTLLVSLMLTTPVASLSAQTIYGLTSTSMEEGNGRLVSFNIDELSTSPDAPTQVTELATIPGANDIMAGAMAGDTYYFYFNTYDNSTGSSRQFFATLDFATGMPSVIAEEDPVNSDHATDFMDIVYDPQDGGLIALDRQYVINSASYISTLQLIDKDNGHLREIKVLDKKYSAIASDGNRGYYLASIDPDGYDQNDERVYHPAIYHADKDFNITLFKTMDRSLPAQSSFAHSMIFADGKLYLQTGQILDVIDVATKQGTAYWLNRDVFGITFAPEKASISLPESDSYSNLESIEYFDISGRPAGASPSAPGLYIRRQGTRAEVISLR